jgi:hypothetical protein
MKYDNITGGTETIEIINQVSTDKTGNNIVMKLLLNSLPGPVQYKLDTSYIKITIKESDGSLIYEVTKFINLISPDIFNIIFTKEFPTDTEDLLVSVGGRIFLTNNTFYDFNKDNLGELENINFNFLI